MVLGDRLDLYTAITCAGPLTPAELAKRTDTAERCVREWLLNEAAGDYVTYDPATNTYTLPDEQALALADEDREVFLPGNFQVMAAAFATLPRLAECFRTGAGIDWGEQDARVARQVGQESAQVRPGRLVLLDGLEIGAGLQLLLDFQEGSATARRSGPSPTWARTHNRT